MRSDEEVYLQRYQAQERAALQGGGLDRYDPLEAVAGSPSAAPLPRSPTPSIDGQALKDARDYAARHNSSALLVWRDGALQSADYFGGVDPQSLLNSKSLAKPVTALLIGRAIEQGYIRSLDQPVSDFFTEWRSDPGRSRILVRHLLDMRSGLMAQRAFTGPDDVVARAYLHPRHDQVLLDDYPLTDPPGTRYEYSNANAELIAPLIERATGRRYGSYLTEALLSPIGAEGGTVWVDRPGGTAHSGCCLLLPAESWLRLGILLLGDGVWNGTRLLPEGYVAQMQRTTAANPHAGLGVWVAGAYVRRRGVGNPEIDERKTLHGAPYLDRYLFLFDGNGHQVLYMVPSLQMAILRTGGYSDGGDEWDNAVLPNLLIAGADPASGRPPPVPQSSTGQDGE